MPKKLILFSGSSHKTLAHEICRMGGFKQGKVQIETFPDGEIGVRILENVHGEDVFVLQTIAHHPNLYLMELFIMLDALKRAGACSLTAVIPHFGYARQDRRVEEGQPISAKLVAQLLESAGASQVITMDLHSLQIEGFFNIPLIHLSAQSLLAEEIRKEGWGKSVMISPDLGSITRARALAQDFKTTEGVVEKHRMSAKRVESNALAGEVKGRDVILVDDLISTGQTMQIAAGVCKSLGAKKIRAVASHGLFINGSFDVDNVIEKVIVTDSVPLPSGFKPKKLKIVSVAPLFARAISSSI